MAPASMAELLPAGFKFDPVDDVLIAHYLLSRLRGQRLPCDGIIVEADPLSAPPWKLLEMYGRKEDAFFFAAGQAMGSSDSRQKRTCVGGGCWKGQKKKLDAGSEKLVVPSTGEEIAWSKYALNFHADGEQGSTGWVMDEYAVTAPTDLASSSSIMAYHIRFTGHGKNSKKHKREDPEPQDWVAGHDAGSTLPPLDGYTSPQPTVVLVGPKATASEHGSSGVMEFAAFQESTDEQRFLVDGFIDLPPAEMSSSSWWGAVELDELLQFVDETPESSCA